MNKDVYTFPAIFSYDPDGISISFPDLPGCLSCADTDEEALFMGKDVLKGFLLLMEDDKEEIPQPSKLNSIVTDENERAVLIEANLSISRKQRKEKAVKKTLTIPSWLNEVATERNVNFSQILKDALIEQLELQ